MSGHQSRVNAHLTFCARGLGRLLQDLSRKLTEEAAEFQEHFEPSLIQTCFQALLEADL